MRQQLLDLWEIQQIDLGIRDLERDRTELPQRLNALVGRINGVQAELKELTGQREALLLEIKTIESAAQQESEKVRKWERRLNEIRNQREYQALSREVEGSRRAIREHEEQVIELMAKKEELDKQIEARQDRLAEDEVDADAERKEVEGQIAAVEERLQAETRRREALVPKIKPNLLKRYDAIRAKRMGIGLVAVKDGSCTGCNMRLPPQQYNLLMRVDSVECCPSCVRIMLYQGVLDEAQAPTPSDATAESLAQATPGG